MAKITYSSGSSPVNGDSCNSNCSNSTSNSVTTTATIHTVRQLPKEFSRSLTDRVYAAISAANEAANAADSAINAPNGITATLPESIPNTSSSSSTAGTPVSDLVSSNNCSSHTINNCVCNDIDDDKGTTSTADTLDAAKVSKSHNNIHEENLCVAEEKIFDLRTYTISSQVEDLEKIGRASYLDKYSNIDRVVFRIPMTKSTKFMIASAIIMIAVIIAFVIFSILLLATNIIHIPNVAPEELTRITKFVGTALCVASVSLSLLWISYLAGFKSAQNSIVDGELKPVISLVKCKLKKYAKDQKNVWRSLTSYHDQLKCMEQRYSNYESSLCKIDTIIGDLESIKEQLAFTKKHTNTSRADNITAELLGITKRLNMLLKK